MRLVRRPRSQTFMRFPAFHPIPTNVSQCFYVSTLATSVFFSFVKHVLVSLFSHFAKVGRASPCVFTRRSIQCGCVCV
uniref:Uncharacterized protein n=1 Tax=Anopheles minimus TaxID=112268 RepID=A0A182WNC4_9DIPT